MHKAGKVNKRVNEIINSKKVFAKFMSCSERRNHRRVGPTPILAQSLMRIRSANFK